MPPTSQCITAAAAHHRVNAALLWAVLRVESGPGMRAQISRNANGTVDIGPAQINSIHLPELSRHGVLPHHLSDLCVSAYVAAWKLAGLVASGGNTWNSIARYHSATPCHNEKYARRLRNELRLLGVLPGPVEPALKC